ncbi:MAG: hypothetical protein HETSPECPRED_007401 [Heterodermia speciosa]|uniref:Uncharacterized protein n=1 Tax=Heterodermia speciosa TaxID=116794 RepID=A0A8H3FT81_9LECA|nr:MAG: hypothetical protein HETSPECPRED_007401 [Heterodermia speciosa]
MPSFAEIMTVAIQVFFAGLWALLWSAIPYGVAPPMWMRPKKPMQTFAPVVFSSVPPLAANFTTANFTTTNITALSLVSPSLDNELIHLFAGFGTTGSQEPPTPLLIGLVFFLFIALVFFGARLDKSLVHFKSGQRKAPTTTTTTTSSGTQTTVTMLPADFKYLVTTPADPIFVFGREEDRAEIAKLRSALSNANARNAILEPKAREAVQLRRENQAARARINQLESAANRPSDPYGPNSSGPTRDAVWQLGQPRVGYGNSNWCPEPINRAEMEIWLRLHPRSSGGGRGGMGGRGDVAGRGGMGGRGDVAGRGGFRGRG